MTIIAILILAFIIGGFTLLKLMVKAALFAAIVLWTMLITLVAAMILSDPFLFLILFVLMIILLIGSKKSVPFHE